MERTSLNPNVPPGSGIVLEETDAEWARDVILRRHTEELISYILADSETLAELLRELLLEASRGTGRGMTERAMGILEELVARGADFVAREHPVEFSLFTA